MTCKDGTEKPCNHDYEITTGTENLKSHLCQIYKILSPEENNNQSIQVVSNQQSLDNFLNKKTPLLFSKQNKITNHIVAWIVDDLQPFYVITNDCFQDMILECEPRFEISYRDQLKKKLMHSLQAELNPEHSVNSLSSDTKTCWSSTYNLLKNLLILHNAILQLADHLKHTEEWKSLDKLVKLLYPFAQATSYIGGSQYPTLGMIIPTLLKLSRHL
ncbi:2616_t:CDS:2 [Gigaspora margarita]|uniref:2616_t:CDS:1 n=1 Tax=Gigaspora margarita TaxID=4874 RepID=A0ABN7W1A9_GIGMA|nr:2616_t:CDS:2 [Gigaspora margarita]